MEEPDDAVIRAAQRGDAEAFTQLVRHYQDPLWRFLVRMVGDTTTADDILQDTLVKVYRKIDGFRFGSSFTTWIYRVARHAAIDELRRRRRRGELADRLARDHTPLTSNPSGQVELEWAIAALPDRLREPLLVVEVFGLKYREAASVLRLPQGTVKRRVFEARQRLTNALGSNDE